MTHFSEVLQNVLGRLGPEGRNAVYSGDSATLRVALLVASFLGKQSPLGTIAQITVPPDCTWVDTEHNDHIELEFISPPVLKVEKSLWVFAFDVNATLEKLDVYLTRIVATVRALGHRREESFEIDWTGP